MSTTKLIASVALFVKTIFSSLSAEINLLTLTLTSSKFLVNLDKVDKIMIVSTEDAKERSRRLCKEMGLLVGISAGANVLAAERWIENNNPNGIVFTSLCDRGERYCSCL